MQDQSQEPKNFIQSTKKNSITITLLSCTIVLLICLIGYEVIKDSFSPAIYAEKKIKAKRPLRIISDEVDHQRVAYTSPIKKTYHAGIQNKPSSNKEKVKIPDIEKSIIANEVLHNRAHSTIRSLEKELEESHKKIESFDYALDTLTSKIELTRAEKEKLEDFYRKQLKYQEETNLGEKEKLNLTLQENIANQYVLKKTIEEKIAKIKEMTDLLAQQREQITEKSHEIDRITTQLEDLNQASHEKIAETTTQLEYEKAQSIYLKGELLKSKDDLSEAHNDIKDFEKELSTAIKSERSLKDSLGQLNTVISIKGLEMGALIDSFSDFKRDMTTEFQDMVFFLNLEKNHSQKMHHQLQLALEKYDEEKKQVFDLQTKLETTIQKAKEAEQKIALQNNLSTEQQDRIHFLIEELDTRQAQNFEQINHLAYYCETEHMIAENAFKQLAAKQKQLATEQEQLALWKENTAKLETEIAKQSIRFTNRETELTQNIQTLKNSLDDEKSHAEKLTRNIQFLSSRYQQERNNGLELQELLLVSLEKALNLEETLANEKSQLQLKEEELQSYQQDIGVEKKHAEELANALSDSISNLENDRQAIVRLEGNLKEEKQKVVFLEVQLGNHLSEMLNKEKEFEEKTTELTKALHDQKNRMFEMTASFEDALLKYTSEENKTKELEKLVNEYGERALYYENEASQLLATIEELRFSLKVEEAHSQEVTNALQEAFTQQYVEEKKATELEEKLMTALEKARLFEEELTQKEAEHDLLVWEQKRMLNLEEDLQLAYEKAESLETELSMKKEKVELVEQQLQVSQQTYEHLLLEQDRSKTLEENLKVLEEKLSDALQKAGLIETELDEQILVISDKEQELKTRDEIVRNLEEQLTQKTRELESKLLSHEQSWQLERNLTNMLEDQLLALQEKTRLLESELEDKRQYILETEQELVVSENHSHQALLFEQTKAQELEEQLTAFQKKTFALENELEMSLKEQISKKELEISLSQEKEHVQELEESLSIALAKVESYADEIEETRDQLAQLEASVEDHGQLSDYHEVKAKADALESQLSSMNYSLEETRASLMEEQQKKSQLSQEIQQEKEYAETLYQTLQETLAHVDEEQRYAQELENRIQIATEQMRLVEDELTFQKAEMESKEKELQLIMDEHTASNLEMTAELNEIREALEEEKMISSKLVEALEKEESLASISTSLE